METKTIPCADTGHIIETSCLTKDYGSGRGVFDVSIHVDKGEVFGFLGPNGAGKSTTIRHLMGFSKPDSGSTKILGQETFRHYDRILNHVGYIPGEIALPAGLTGWEFIRMMQDMQKIHNEPKLEEMLSLFELEDNVLRGETKRMSLGVKRKLAVVTAFMSDPEVLICRNKRKRKNNDHPAHHGLFEADGRKCVRERAVLVGAFQRDCQTDRLCSRRDCLSGSENRHRFSEMPGGLSEPSGYVPRK